MLDYLSITDNRRCHGSLHRKKETATRSAVAPKSMLSINACFKVGLSLSKENVLFALMKAL